MLSHTVSVSSDTSICFFLGLCLLFNHLQLLRERVNVQFSNDTFKNATDLELTEFNFDKYAFLSKSKNIIFLG